VKIYLQVERNAVPSILPELLPLEPTKRGCAINCAIIAVNTKRIKYQKKSHTHGKANFGATKLLPDSPTDLSHANVDLLVQSPTNFL
jgi:hypothetical protein